MNVAKKSAERLDPPPNRRPWFKSTPTLSALLSTVFGVSVLLVCMSGGAFALWNFRQEKTQDTLAILYLELERTGLALQRTAENFAETTSFRPDSAIGQAKAPDIVARIEGTKVTSLLLGRLPGKVKLDKALLAVGDVDDQHVILQVGGTDYLAKVAGRVEVEKFVPGQVTGSRFLLLWRTNIAEWVGATARNSVSRIYVITRQGDVLFSNHSSITRTNYLDRTLVQTFIKAPLKIGQVGFEDEKGEEWYGFFSEVPNTNLVVFTESPSSIALAPVKAAVWRFVLVMMAALVFAILMLQMFLALVTAPMARLVQLTRQVAAGVFDGTVIPQGCRETRELAMSFQTMTGSLAHRDNKIKQLMVEQTAKVRMESEIALARTVQKNLLPTTKLAQTSGLDLAVFYQPMTELAGDWYGYSTSDDGAATTVALADISGHGAGSAMFMTLIAGAFEELRLSQRGAPSPEDFVRKTHALIGAVGRGEWHATMVVFQFHHTSRNLHIVGAGHPFPILTQIKGGQRVSQFIRLPSTYVGGPGLELAQTNIVLESGMSLAVYSDGLTQAQNAAGRAFGSRKLKDAFSRSGSAHAIVGAIATDWQTFMQDEPSNDDCCLLVARSI